MIRILFASSTTACFELENTNPYYAEKPYTVTLNGATVGEKKENVFSLYHLTPDTAYTVGADGETLEFRTKPETACLDVKANGAVGDGAADDTLALQLCIDACPPGGRVYVPAGTYAVGPLVLKSDMTLELEEGATLLGSTDQSRYPLLPGKLVDEAGREYLLASWEGDSMPSQRSFVSAYRAKNLYVVGLGTIDGNAQNGTWWENVKQRKTGRPRLVFLNGCEHVVFHGVTGQNGASWNFHPYFSKDLGFFDIRINAPKDSPNTDGLDPECCDGVDIVGCVFSTGDDCIAIKSGKLALGRKYKTPANHHTIRNCLMQFGHGAIVLGSEMSGGVKNLSVKQCVFNHTDRGLRIKSRRGRGKDGIIDDVLFENIRMIDVLTPLVINMYYFCDPDGKTEIVWSREPHPVDDSTPYLGKFTFRDMVCTGCEYAAGYFDGLVEQPIREIVIENVSFSFKENAGEGYPAMMSYISKFSRAGLYFDNVEKAVVRGVKFENVIGETIIRKHCPSVTVE